LGSPENVTVTPPVNPFCAVKVNIVVPVAPWAMVRDVGDAVSVNPGAGAMVSAMAVFAVSVPEAPVIVIVAFPEAAVLAAVKVSLRGAVPDAEAKVAVTPAGRPDAVRVTAPLKPF